MALKYSTHLRNLMLGKAHEVFNVSGVGSTYIGESTSVASFTAVAHTLTNTGGYFRLDPAASGTAGEFHPTTPMQVRRNRLYKITFTYKVEASGAAQVVIKDQADSVTLYDSGSLTATTDTTVTAYFKVPDTVDDDNVIIRFWNNATVDDRFAHFKTISLVDMSRAFRDIFNDCKLQVRSGTQPSDGAGNIKAADQAAGGTLLCTFYNAATSTIGLTFDEAVLGQLLKKTGETWSGVNVATGTATWFRLCLRDDPGTEDSSFLWPRMDGSVGLTASANLVVSTTSFVDAATAAITTFALTFPTSSTL